MPLIAIEREMLTPNQVLRELDANTDLAPRLRSEIERLHSIEPPEHLAVKRIMKQLEGRPLDQPYVYFITAPGERSYYTPGQIIEAVTARTPVGDELIEDEVRYLRYLYALGGNDA
jgi:hypothetical protein